MKVDDSKVRREGYLLLCLADGSIYSLSAWSGAYQAVIHNEPLLSSNGNNNDKNHESESIIPSLDGRLYWRLAGEQEALHELPLTVNGILENPVRSCDEDSSDNCGILTAQTVTSLLALSDDGGLLWKTQKNSGNNNAEQQPPTQQNPALLLQRKDYWIQHVMAKSGKQSWNVSLGTYQALDFDLPKDDDDDSKLLLDDDGIDEQVILPAIIFSNAGRTLTAVDPQDQEHILWRQDVPSTLSSVFGISNGQWKTVQVIQPQQHSSFYFSSDYHHKQQQQLLPSSSQYNAEYYEHFLWKLHHQQQAQNPQRALPSPENCRVEHDGSIQCDTPGLYKHPPLRLPAGETLPGTSQQNGIFLSWGLLNSILCGIAFLWFMLKLGRKKQSRSPVVETSSSSSGEPQQRRAIQRSTSLPGNLGSPDPYMEKLAMKSDEGVVPSPKEETTFDSSAPNEPAASIPLVRYSRYDSEFQEIQKLGKGGFGSVFECKNVLDGRRYAVKKVGIRQTKDYDLQLHRVLREVKILAMLDHANIVRYYTAWLEEQSGDVMTSADDDETRQSVFDSDSISTWDASRKDTMNGCDRSSKYNHRSPGRRARRASGNSALRWNPLGWNAEFGVGDSTESSLVHRSRNLPSTDDFMIFEDSKENYEQSDSLFDRRSEIIFESTVVNPQEQADNNINHNSTPHHKASSQSLASGPGTHHILYIQMQLCSEKTLTEFLMDSNARNDTSGMIDFPKALRLFHQIAQAVQYVHGRGLIHRDLKPMNCFMNDDLCVKVGDFGLSRESSVDEDPSISNTNNSVQDRHDLHEDHTAGVGTRSYASPEQMNGSSYDASTDVYSLGIMLFELLYPMYTGMERSLCLGRLRNGQFPGDWQYSGFPSIQELILRMLSTKPSDRPSAGEVADHIESILSEFTIVSLDHRKYENSTDPVTLLRVEAMHKEDTLRSTMECIEKEDAKIIEYGLRVVNDASIMEFAIRNTNSDLIPKLRRHPSIFKVRQVSASSVSSRSN